MCKNSSVSPKKIKPCPIQEAILEIKFDPIVPSSVVLGIIYPKINTYFKKEPISLPVLQLPEQIRESDKNLQFAPYYRFENESKFLNIGPKVLSFVNSGKYKGWEDFSKFFYDALEKILSAKIFKEIISLELRYINVFEENIFNFINLIISLNNKRIKNEPTEINTVITDGSYENIIRVGNSFDINTGNEILNRSIIDINCVRKITDVKHFINNHKDIIEESHKIEKEIFFQILKKEYTSKFNPMYEGENYE
jgi:uncharacterized protein (TIGR04255 family)